MSERREFLKTEWHPTLNENLTIDELSESSAKEIYWQCLVNTEHVWQAKFFSRNKDNRGCPYCSGHKILPKDSLGHNFPKLLAEWDFEKNKNIDPFKIRATSKKVWWMSWAKSACCRRICRATRKVASRSSNPNSRRTMRTSCTASRRWPHLCRWCGW